MKKTLQKCKEIVAKEEGWNNWRQLQNTLYMNEIEELTDLANKMYYEQSEIYIQKTVPPPPKDRILKEGKIPVKPLPSPPKQ
jgi:hypothetical protein